MPYTCCLCSVDAALRGSRHGRGFLLSGTPTEYFILFGKHKLHSHIGVVVFFSGANSMPSLILVPVGLHQILSKQLNLAFSVGFYSPRSEDV